MLNYLPSDCTLKNVRKMSCLKLLELQALNHDPWLSSGNIASILEYNNKERAGLYSALPRWTAFHLINRKPKRRRDVSGEPSSRYLYSIAPRGLQRLTRIYRDEVNSKIPPGRIAYVIATLLGLTFWWQYRERGRFGIEGRNHLLYIGAPFSGSDDYQEITDYVPGQPFSLFGCHSSVRFDDVASALHKVESLGLEVSPELLKAVLDSPVSGLSRVTDANAIRKTYRLVLSSVSLLLLSISPIATYAKLPIYYFRSSLTRLNTCQLQF